MLPLNGMFADYRANQYGREILSDWASALIYRPIGIILAWLLTATRITPNAVTATGALLLPCMLAMAILFQPAAALASVLVLAFVFLVLDCTDGSLARATGHVSVSGHYWDLVTDLAYRGCIYVTVGYLADQISPWTLPVSQMSCMALAAWAAALARLARFHLDRLAPAENAGQGKAASFTAYSFLSGLDTFFPALVALAWAAGLLSFFIAWVVFYSFADVLVALHEARGRLKSSNE